MWKSLFAENRSVTRTWFLSYVLILIIPVMICFTTYFETKKVVEKEVEKSNALLLKRVQEQMDSMFRNIENLQIEISLNSNLMKLANMEALIEDTQYYDIYKAFTDVTLMNSPRDWFDGFYLYFQNIDRILSPSTSLGSKGFYKGANTFEGMPYEKWFKMMNEYHKGTFKNAPALKHWMAFDGNFAETPFAKELEKRTGVHVEYITPAKNKENESYQLMIASNDLPDIIEYSAAYLPSAFENGVIIALNDLIDKYSPNLKKILKQYPDIDKPIKLDNGTYTYYPYANLYPFDEKSGKRQAASSYGTVIRKDWLDDLNLSVPTTMDEWEKALRAFKEKKGATAPLALTGASGVFSYGFFTSAYGIKKDYYQENGKVKFGPAEPGYREFLETMRRWYAEGLLDKNYATTDAKTLDNNMMTGESGATVAWLSSNVVNWMKRLRLMR